MDRDNLGEVSLRTDVSKLTELNASDQRIGSLSGIENLATLKALTLDNNQIRDVSPLSGLTALTTLRLGNNQITDVSPLVDNVGLGSGDTILLTGNPLSADALETQIPDLEERGVTVDFDKPEPEGEPFEIYGFVTSAYHPALDDLPHPERSERVTLILRARAPADILSDHAVGLSGEEISWRDFRKGLGGEDASQVIIQFNSSGSGILRLQLHNPEQPRPLRDDEEIFERHQINPSVTNGVWWVQFALSPSFFQSGHMGSAVELADDTVLLDPNGNQIELNSEIEYLMGLGGEAVFVQGEVFVTEEDVRYVVSLVKVLVET